MVKIDIISGFLGAGKTTLIKKLLKEAFEGEQVVLIENEFGEIGIDGGFLKDAGIEIREMNSGCICCSLVGDFGASLKEVVEKYHPDRILIEPSGVGKLSDVIKAVQGVEEDVDIQLNSYTTVVDAKKCKMYMRNFGEFFDNQVQYAGAIIMSRTDIVDEKKAMESMELLRSINEKAAIITTPIEKLDGKKILEVMEHPVSLADELLKEEQEHHHAHDDECGCGHDHDHEHHHHDHDDECGCGHDHDHEHHHHDHDDECGCARLMMTSAAADMTTITSIIITTMMTSAADTTTIMSIIITHDEECDCGPLIIITTMMECSCGHDHDHEHHHHDHDDECGCGHDHDHDHHHDHDEECGCGHDHDHEHHHDHDEECGCGHHHDHHHHHADEVFTSWGRETIKKFTREGLEKMLESLSASEEYGVILRAKGMLPAEDGTWIYFDMVPEETEIREGSPEYTGRLCVIGSKLNEEKLAKLFGVA